MQVKTIKIDNSDSVLLEVKRKGKTTLSIWFDLYIEDGEITGDWNKCIFNLNNSLDLEIRQFQSCANNFMYCMDAAIEAHNNTPKFKKFFY